MGNAGAGLRDAFEVASGLYRTSSLRKSLGHDVERHSKGHDEAVVVYSEWRSPECEHSMSSAEYARECS
jgi:hypothetical protein